MPPASVQRQERFPWEPESVTRANLATSAVITCAVFRSVIRPEEGRFAYLRVGTTEFLYFIMVIGLGIGLGIGLLIGGAHQGIEDFVGEFAGDALQAALVRCQRKINRHHRPHRST